MSPNNTYTNKETSTSTASTSKKIKSVCIFGTSADPPTGKSGHIGIVKHLSSLEQFDEIWILPVYQHMYKSKRSRLSSFTHRINMCQLAFDDIENAYVYDYEKVCYETKCNTSTTDDNPIRVGTADLLEWLIQDKFQNERIDFTLVLGSDSFLDLSSFKWKRSLDIIQLVQGRILVISRKQSQHGVDNEYNDDNISSVAQKMNVKYDANIQILIVDCLSDVSSTLVRNTNDINLLMNYVKPSILEYMQKHKLYAFFPQQNGQNEEN